MDALALFTDKREVFITFLWFQCISTGSNCEAMPSLTRPFWLCYNIIIHMRVIVLIVIPVVFAFLPAKKDINESRV